MKVLFYSLIFFTLIISISCNNDDDTPVENTITIEIESPANNAIITSTDDNVHVHILIQATLDLHNISTVIHPIDDHDNKVLEEPGHGSGSDPWSYEVDVPMSNFTSGTTYVLEIEACGDHLCEGANKISKAHQFTIQ